MLSNFYSEDLKYFCWRALKSVESVDRHYKKKKKIKQDCSLGTWLALFKTENPGSSSGDVFIYSELKRSKTKDSNPDKHRYSCKREKLPKGVEVSFNFSSVKADNAVPCLERTALIRSI